MDDIQNMVEYAKQTLQQLPEWESLKEKFASLEPELLSELAGSRYPLTFQETRILFMQRLGISDKRIAELLWLAVGTVVKHRVSASHKLHPRS